MKLNRRLTLSLLGGVAAVSLGFAMIQARAEMHVLEGEVARQASVLAQNQRQAVEHALESGLDLEPMADRFGSQDHPAGMAIYDERGRALAVSSGLKPRLETTPGAVVSALDAGQERAQLFRLDGRLMHIFVLPLYAGGRLAGALAIVHDVRFIAVPVLRHAATSVAQTVLIVGLTLLIVRWNLGRPLQHLTDWLRDLRTGRAGPGAAAPKEDIFRPLTNEVARMATSLNAARRAAEEEARLREAALSRWTPERLRVSMQNKMNGSRLFAVSNREPYEHFYRGTGIVWSVPPSGLVTALEPVLRACDGTWVAQGTGDADRETSDERGRLRVPPDHPQYTLRRVWLGKEEEEGFYFGFANEGLWPLCHIAHTRPTFRATDWEQYLAVNRKFADVLLDEMAAEKEPLVLVQDYHFALLPRLLKERRPDARIAIFWHIPWPNPEAFGICPWQSELLDGMLGADLAGFHIQAHCNNFLETVDRALESRIDWEHFAVNRREHLTSVRPFPISVEFSEDGEAAPRERAELFRGLGQQPQYLGLGVDRVDYTKGIPERFRAIERFLDRYPSYREQLIFAQIGAPSRTRIRRYQELMAEVESEAERINRRFRTGAWKPIVFLNQHHGREEIARLYRQADFCLVTSLHDGMNLVAKEYIAARGDEQGALILSRFAGASHELTDALVVSPYDTDELAEAIRTALAMPAEEKRARMRRMRAIVEEHNVYRWAGNLIAELASIRLEPAAGVAAGGLGTEAGEPAGAALVL
jgi:trehalose 6-phosphate synthase